MTELKDFAASTVIVGNLNPLIFSPEWLLANNAIGPEESATAREKGIEVLAPNIASISLGSMKLIVEQARFALTVSEEPLVRAKDFPATCFKHLSHTPVIAMGFNLNATLHRDDVEKWHKFGDTLAPKAVWGDFLTDSKGRRLGGLRALVMEQEGAPGGRKGYVRFSVQASETNPEEAILQVNTHFAMGSMQEPSTGGEAYRIIEDIWDDSMQQSRDLINRIKEVADVA